MLKTQPSLKVSVTSRVLKQSCFHIREQKSINTNVLKLNDNLAVFMVVDKKSINYGIGHFIINPEMFYNC